MHTLWKDLLTAMLLGMVLPGILLNGSVMLLRNRGYVEEIRITVPEETQPEQPALPVLVRSVDGRAERQDMDAYLVGVILAEMPAYYEAEALKAQCVAARTYARKAWETGGKHGDGSVCTESSCCQAWISEESYLEKGGTPEGLTRVTGAVRSTSGLCLQYEGNLIEATYFSCSGGTTESALAVWGTDYPYLQSVDSPGEEEADRFTDTVYFSAEEFCRMLGMEKPEQLTLGEVTYTDGGGVASMTVGERVYTGTQMRSLLGLRSAAFSISASGETVTVTTRGYGHRVGMSQYGAEAMAVEGSSFREILAHYYPGTELIMIEA